MIKKFLYMIMVSFCALTATAQNEDEQQVLVYRNSGEIHLFFAHELDSIVLSHFDADSLWYETPVSQVFHTADTACVVPLCEIDSVAFGSRNETVLQPNARILTAADSTWIIRYDGVCIYFNSQTPTNILPRKGEKLFYGKQDGLFPMGLIARVDDVSLQNNEYKVAVTDVELKDVFSRLFYAGSISDLQPNRKATRAITIPSHRHRISLAIDGDKGISMSGNADFTISGKVVTNPLTGYYYMEGMWILIWKRNCSVR